MTDISARRRRRSPPPTKPKPPIIIAHKVGSGTAATPGRSNWLAADRLVSLSAPREIRWQFVVEMLTALGRDDDALKVAESAIYGPQVPSTKILFQPSLARARALPEFAELAGRLGLTEYWRQTGNLPDFCLVADAPTFCKGLRRPAHASPRAVSNQALSDDGEQRASCDRERKV